MTGGSHGRRLPRPGGGMMDVTRPAEPDPRQQQRAPRLLRVLPAEDAGDGGEPVGRRSSAWRRCRRLSCRSPTAPAARPASAPTRPSLRLLDRDRAHARRRISPASRATRSEVDEVVARLCASRRPPHRGAPRRSGGRHRRGLSAPPRRLRKRRRAGCRHRRGSAISRFPSPPTRRSIRRARASPPTSTC